jgi:KDO2-lipid IV(A) lauroyltransferase
MARRRQPILDWLVYAGVRVVAMVFQMFPVDENLRTARLVGRIWWRMMPRHRDRAREHLRASFGESLSAREIDRVALKSMQQMVMMAIEALFTPRLINEWTWPQYLRLRELGPGLELLLDRKGVIMLTGHYGNWELLGFTLTALGFPVTAVMRPLDNPYLNSFLLDVRARRGLQLLYKKGATQSADDILESGGTLCFIADQNAGHKGEFVNFFGRPASTYKSIALLAIQHEVPIVIGYARRTSPRFRYEIGCTRISHPREWQGRENEVHWITQEYTNAIERIVREAPEQYLWIHRRWKSQPKKAGGRLSVFSDQQIPELNTDR